MTTGADVTSRRGYVIDYKLKIKLVAMMSSANGVIPAGVVSFNVCEAEPMEKVEQTLQLEKCPDRSATIRFVKWYEFIRTTTNMQGGYNSSSGYMDARYMLRSNNNNNGNGSNGGYHRQS